MKLGSRLLVLGYGNPARLDDGLGPAFADAVEDRGLSGVSVDIDYQLTVEDAALAAEHDMVLFADASINAPPPFSLSRLQPRVGLGFTSHSVEPEAILALAAQIRGTSPQGFALGIRGYDFDDFGEGLSPEATQNLVAAVEEMVPVIMRRELRAASTVWAPTRDVMAGQVMEEVGNARR